MTTRKQIAAAFRAAVPHLWDGYNPWDYKRQKQCICTALCLGTTHKARFKARDVIMARLGFCLTVTEWLSFNAKIPRRQLTERNVQAYRHRWLRTLIKEFEA